MSPVRIALTLLDLRLRDPEDVADCEAWLKSYGWTRVIDLANSIESLSEMDHPTSNLDAQRPSMISFNWSIIRSRNIRRDFTNLLLTLLKLLVSLRGQTQPETF
jgi:hypothetical protein